jgi:hypothetical protein
MQNANNTRQPRRGDPSSGADLGTEGRSSHMLRLDLVSPVFNQTQTHDAPPGIAFHDLFKYFNTSSLFKIFREFVKR